MNHPERQIQADGTSGVVSKRFEQNVARSAREIENAIRAANLRQPHQPSLPPPVLAERQELRDEVVPIGDRREQPADVALFAFGSGDGGAE